MQSNSSISHCLFLSTGLISAQTIHPQPEADKKCMT